MNYCRDNEFNVIEFNKILKYNKMYELSNNLIRNLIFDGKLTK